MTSFNFSEDLGGKFMKTFIAICTISTLIFLNLMVTPGSVLAESQAVCKINIEEEPTLGGQRVAQTLKIKMYNTDPELLNTWNSLFGVDPETSPNI